MFAQSNDCLYFVYFVPTYLGVENWQMGIYSSSNEDDNKESKEPDYDDEEKSDKVGEEKQEEEIGEITTTTVNTIF